MWYQSHVGLVRTRTGWFYCLYLTCTEVRAFNVIRKYLAPPDPWTTASCRISLISFKSGFLCWNSWDVSAMLHVACPLRESCCMKALFSAQGWQSERCSRHLPGKVLSTLLLLESLQGRTKVALNLKRFLILEDVNFLIMTSKMSSMSLSIFYRDYFLSFARRRKTQL